jgi:hypothetical protein
MSTGGPALGKRAEAATTKNISALTDDETGLDALND